MITKEILESHPVTILKKELSKTNIKGYSKMKKSQVVALMLKPEHSKRFSHIVKKGEQPKPKKVIKIKKDKKEPVIKKVIKIIKDKKEEPNKELESKCEKAEEQAEKLYFFLKDLDEYDDEKGLKSKKIQDQFPKWEKIYKEDIYPLIQYVKGRGDAKLCDEIMGKGYEENLRNIQSYWNKYRETNKYYNLQLEDEAKKKARREEKKKAKSPVKSENEKDVNCQSFKNQSESLIHFYTTAKGVISKSHFKGESKKYINNLVERLKSRRDDERCSKATLEKINKVLELQKKAKKEEPKKKLSEFTKEEVEEKYKDLGEFQKVNNKILDRAQFILTKDKNKIDKMIEIYKKINVQGKKGVSSNFNQVRSAIREKLERDQNNCESLINSLRTKINFIKKKGSKKGLPFGHKSIKGFLNEGHELIKKNSSCLNKKQLEEIKNLGIVTKTYYNNLTDTIKEEKEVKDEFLKLYPAKK